MANVTPGYTFTSSTDPITSAKLNLVSQPTVTIGAGEVVTASLASSIGITALTVSQSLLATGIQALTTAAGTGAVQVSQLITELTSTGTDALSMADGTNGQFKIIRMVVDGGDATLTPTTKTGYSTIKFTAVGNSVTLQYRTTTGWWIVSSYGVTIA